MDLGAGTAANLGRLIEMGLPFASYTAVDVTGAMLKQTRTKYEHLPQTHFHQMDLMTDPLPIGPFDLIISTWALEHMDGPAQVVNKAWQQLAPGGHMTLLFEVEGQASWKITYPEFKEMVDMNFSTTAGTINLWIPAERPILSHDILRLPFKLNPIR